MGSPTTESAEPRIVWEDEELWLIHKPALVHSVDNPDKESTSVARWLLDRHPALSSVGDRPEDAGLIHRLDYSTSGVLIGARTAHAWKRLREQLLAGKIEKRYSCLVEGEMRGPVAAESYLGSPNRQAKKVKVYKSKPPAGCRALPGKTSFTPVATREGVTLAIAKADVARRHQVRAHAASLGYPLVGDSLYGAKLSLENIFPGEGELPMFYLHAEFVRLRHPMSGAEVEFAVDRPDYIRRLFGK